MGKPTDLVQGTLDLLILRAIEHEPKHGWAIAKRIQQVSNDVLKVQQGSLYPAFHSLILMTRVRAGNLPDVVLTDGLSFLTAAGCLLLVTLAASYVPARRAMFPLHGLDPAWSARSRGGDSSWTAHLPFNPPKHTYA